MSAGGCFHTDRTPWNCVLALPKPRFIQRGCCFPGLAGGKSLARAWHSHHVSPLPQHSHRVRVNTDLYCMLLLHYVLQRVSCCNRLFKTLAKQLAKLSQNSTHACGNTNSSKWVTVAMLKGGHTGDTHLPVTCSSWSDRASPTAIEDHQNVCCTTV